MSNRVDRREGIIITKLGLQRVEIERKFKAKGITDENLINAIADVIEENNNEIRKNVSKVVNEDAALDNLGRFF